MLGIFLGILVLVWLALFVIAFCPLRAARLRREQTEVEEAAEH